MTATTNGVGEANPDDLKAELEKSRSNSKDNRRITMGSNFRWVYV